MTAVGRWNYVKRSHAKGMTDEGQVNKCAVIISDSSGCHTIDINTSHPGRRGEYAKFSFLGFRHF